MKEWLLKEEKNKVGRPKLAGTSVVRKAEILIAFSLCICFVLAFCFICELEGTDPKKRAYTLTIGKLTGNIKNPNGFIIKDYYDKDYNYIMDIKIPESIKNYSGSYKYTTYYLSNNGWKEKETKPFDKDIKIKLESKKNKNVTWKVKLQIVMYLS